MKPTLFFTAVLGIASMAMASDLDNRLSFSSLHLLLIDHKGNVLSCGEAFRGILGHPELQCITAAQDPKVIESLRGKRPRQVVAGRDVTFILFQNGSVYSCGWNAEKLLGYPNEECQDCLKNSGSIFQSIPHQIESLQNIVLVTAGKDFALGLNSTGKIMMWGKDNHQCHVISGLKTLCIKNIVAGWRGVLAVQDNNTLWSFDTGGGTGVVMEGSENEPCNLSEQEDLMGEEIARIVMGAYHGLILTKNGIVITLGANCLASQELYPSQSVKYELKKLTAFDNKFIKNITAGEDFSAALDINGKIWYLGTYVFENDKYQNPEILVNKEIENKEIYGIKSCFGSKMLAAASDDGVICFYPKKAPVSNFEITYPGPRTLKENFGPWKPATHRFEADALKKTVLTMMLIQKYGLLKPKPPKPILFIIFNLLKFK